MAHAPSDIPAQVSPAVTGSRRRLSPSPHALRQGQPGTRGIPARLERGFTAVLRSWTQAPAVETTWSAGSLAQEVGEPAFAGALRSVRVRSLRVAFPLGTALSLPLALAVLD